MGDISKNEILMLSFGILALFMWVFGKQLGLNSATAAIIVLCLLVISNIITWEDVVTNKNAFKVFIWFATLVAMASGLNEVGFLTWAANLIASNLEGMKPVSISILLLVLFFVFHYLFASITAHAVALMPLFLGVAIQLIPADMIKPFSILLAGSLGLMGIITPYATGPSPIWYGAGYISQATWWRLGLIFGAINLLALSILGYFIL